MALRAAPAAPSYLFKRGRAARSACVRACVCAEEKLQDREGHSVVEEDSAIENTTEKLFCRDLKGFAEEGVHRFFRTFD